MGAAVGLPVLRLVRIAIGESRLAGLAPGEWRATTSRGPSHPPEAFS
jgi:23S rRNA pseudouridine2457 synthase